MVMIHFFSYCLDPGIDVRIALFMSTGPWAGHGYKHHIHLEPAIGVEGFIAIQLACQRGQYLIQASSALQKLPHGEISCLIGVGEPVSRDCKIDKVMGGSLLSVEFRLVGMMQRFS